MPLPRPASPRVLWTDLRAFLSERPRHQWAIAAISALIPALIILAFFIDSGQNIRPREEIVYFKSWPATRTDAEIRASNLEMGEHLVVVRVYDIAGNAGLAKTVLK